MHVGNAQPRVDAGVGSAAQRIGCCVDILAVGPGQAADGTVADLLRHELHGPEIARRRDWKTCFDDIYSQLRQGVGNLDLFGWVGAFSSAVPREPKLGELLSNTKKKNDKLNLLWIGCGNKDFLFKANQKFITRLNTEKIKHVAHITSGGHEWRLWRQYLNELVPLLFKSDN